MAWLQTQFAGFSCEFSPFHGNLVAVGTAQYYGIVGNGRLHVFDIHTQQPVADWLTQDGVYDVAWSEGNEHVLATAQGDGTLKLFDWTQPQGPILSIDAHATEIYGMDWNLHDKNLVSTAAADQTVKVWDVSRGVGIQTFAVHQAIAYAAIWAPSKPSTLASVGGDAMLHIMDLQAGVAPVSSIQAHQHEILAVDWNKYNEFQVITGSVDKTIRIFDLRRFTAPVQVLHGHQLAVRRVKAHPHCGHQLVSASYDMSMKVWDVNMGQMVQHFDHHSEFVLGVDLSLFEENLVATSAWDHTTCVWNLQGPPPRGRPPRGDAPPMGPPSQ